VRFSIIAIAFGLFSCLMALVIWWARPTEAATVRQLVFAAATRNAPVSGMIRLPTLATKPENSKPENSKPATSSETEILQHITPSGHYVLYHPEALRSDGTYDVIIHFHGIPQALGPALRASGLKAVLLILESGVVTADYRDAYGQSGTLGRLLSALRVQMTKVFKGKDVHERRVAVSAWSAGSGAVVPMLKRNADLALLDAVLISDGLHASFVEPARRMIGGFQLEAVRLFAEEAMAGRKLLAISHTAIQTGEYASTTETANELLHLLDLSPVYVVDPPASDGPIATSRTERGSFKVLGYDGNDKQAHARQQWSIGQILWSNLKDRWQH
jgi:hypothetical protein